MKLLNHVPRFAFALLLGAGLAPLVSSVHAMETRGDTLHVFPGDVIQDAVRASSDSDLIHKVIVHEGTYRPAFKGQALVWFNRHFNGIELRAEGRVILTAANPEITDPTEPGYPAVVNHILYFGVGVDKRTIVDGFIIQGANNFVSTKHTRLYEPSRLPPKNEYFYQDGGGVKVFGASSPVLKNLVIENHFTSPCGAGISIQQEGYDSNPVLIENCVLRNNRAQVTGAAIDLLPGSSALIRNCLFERNVSNVGVDVVSLRSDALPFTNNGVVTVFAASSAVLERCTFVNNRNGIDEMGGRSRIINCLFWNNQLDDGLKGFDRFDLDLAHGGQMLQNAVQGPNIDPKGALKEGDNILGKDDPDFDVHWTPHHPAYQDVGYRPAIGK